MNPIKRIIERVGLFGLWPSLQIAVYPLRKAYASARFAGPQRRGPALWLAAWRELRGKPCPSAPPGSNKYAGRVLSHTVNGQTVVFSCTNANIHITVLSPDLMRIQLQRPGEEIDTFSYAVAKPDAAWPAVSFVVRRSGSATDIATERLLCRVQEDDSHISFIDPQKDTQQRDAVICSEAQGMSWSSALVRHAVRLADDEHIYGLGEKAFGLDRRGYAFEMWNSDPNGAYPPGKDPLYLNIPFYIALRSAAAYGIFYDNTYRSRMDVGASSADVLLFESSAGPLRYYFFYGPPVATILERYTELTGRMRMPPLWALGYQQSRWSYTPDSQVREIARQFRSRRIPCDAIHLDIHYMDGYRCFTWHPQRFPDPAGLINDLHRQGFKIVPLIDCGIKSDHAYTVCRDGIAHKVFCAFPDGSLFHGPVWPGDCYFPDFTSPRVRSWWAEQYRALLATGVDGVWNDMNEPTVLSWIPDTLPDCVCHDWEGRGSTHAQAHNVYGLQMARATSEGLEALRPDRRPFVISRSAWAGLQRYAMNWTGDNISTWDHLRLTVPMVVNLGLCGLAFTGPDTGGFAGDCEAELLTRWIQLGVFTPFLRNHSALKTANQEPWLYGEPYESINRRYIELRYHLLPYIYTTFWQCAQTGLPMLRPLFLHWQQDENAHTCDDEFMFGDALLIAPIGYPAATTRTVYLPAGVWYDWWTGQRRVGGQTVEVTAPLDRLPIFARAGSVVPGGPVMQYVGEQPMDKLTLHIFPGDGHGLLYEDDGQTLANQRGDYRLTRFHVQSTNDNLTLDLQIEGSFAPAYGQVELVVHGVDGAMSASAEDEAASGMQFDPVAHTSRCLVPLASVYQIKGLQ